MCNFPQVPLGFENVDMPDAINSSSTSQMVDFHFWVQISLSRVRFGLLEPLQLQCFFLTSIYPLPNVRVKGQLLPVIRNIIYHYLKLNQEQMIHSRTNHKKHFKYHHLMCKSAEFDSNPGVQSLSICRNVPIALIKCCHFIYFKRLCAVSQTNCFICHC